MELLYEDLSGTLTALPELEQYFNEFDSGVLYIYTGNELTDSQIYQIEQNILSQEVRLLEPVGYDSGVLVIKFQKAIAPLLIITLAIGGVVAAVTGWQIFKSTQLGVPLWVWAVGGLGLLYLFFSSDTGKATTGTVINIGKGYVAKKVGG